MGGIIFILTGTSHGPEETPASETLIQVSVIEEYKNKIARLEKEFSSSVQAQKQLSLEKDELRKHFEEAKVQLEKFDFNAQQLTEEREELQKKAEEERVQSSSLQAEIRRLEDAQKRLEAQSGEKIQKFQDELTKILAEKEEFGKGKEVSLRVSGENENLKKQNEESGAKINTLDQELISLKKTLEESNQRNEQNGTRVEQLQREKDELSQNKTTLELNFNKLTEMNKFFEEEGKILKEELMKSRAQALGLEKICAEFKIQLDQMDQAAEKVG